MASVGDEWALEAAYQQAAGRWAGLLDVNLTVADVATLVQNGVSPHEFGTRLDLIAEMRTDPPTAQHFHTAYARLVPCPRPNIFRRVWDAVVHRRFWA